MKKSIAAIAGAVCAVALLIPATAHAQKSNVIVKNKSDWEIHQFFLSSVDTDKWGPDQLGNQVIGTGETFTLKGVPCDSYDVKLVDEDGDECVVSGVDICGDQQGWVINNDDLLDCEGDSSGE
ncbi:MAG TPA: hypothetical protein VEW48_18535 [Thermoanaerobaculia bacterium]|nr:hypothetical protein [Thermoanaerobaculia bacterium]